MKKLPKGKGNELRKDTKSYYVATALDRAESDRMLQPLPQCLELLDKDGLRLTVTLASRIFCGCPRPTSL